jgi:DNA-binding NarL/FixJ family response regulator
MQGVRVLVVDDFEEWRRELCASIQELPDLQVVGEAADGLEAVNKTLELRPDLILLDISLPRLNGIEVARRVSKLCPESKIIFVTENRSSEIREEGFRAGGSAFVIKSDSASELIAAINFVLKRKNS